VSGFVSQLGTWAKEHPGEVLDFLRHVKPVMQIKNICIVTSHSGCRHVLSEDADFAVIYADKMKMITEGDNFFLGMDDDEPAATSARSAMSLVFRREDVTTIVMPALQALCSEALQKVGTRFDAVSDFFRLVPPQFAIRYFGFSSEVDPAWLLGVTQTLFEYLFIDIENDPEIAARAVIAASEMRRMLEREIELGSKAPSPDTVLGRALRLSATGHPAFTPRAIRNNFIGLLIGLAPTTAKSAAMALDLLMRDPANTSAVKQAAHGPFQDFNAMVREATRLNPINPGLFRKARRDTFVLSDGSATPVEKDTLVFVGTSSAMRDPHHVPDPQELRPNRPESAYLTYGFGLHACFGRYINDLHIAILLQTLLVSGDVRRADGPEGGLLFDGAFPCRFVLER
jgi:cytochrome P450